MNRILSIFVKFSSLFLWSAGIFLLIQDYLYPDYKLGPIPSWIVILGIVISGIPTTVAFLTPNFVHSKIVVKIILAIVITPAFVLFWANSYDCWLRVYQGRYVEPFFEIILYSIGFLTCLIGYFLSFQNNILQKGSEA